MSLGISGYLAIVTVFWNALAVAPAGAATAAGFAPPAGCEIVAHRAGTDAENKAPNARKAIFPPVQLEIRTPVAPIAFPSGGRNYLFYELHLQNFANAPLTLRGIEVVGADNAMEAPIAEFKEARLDTLLRALSFNGTVPADNRRLEAGQSVVAYLCLAFDGNMPIPGELRHRMLLVDSVAEGPVMVTRRTALPVFGPPLEGTDWIAFNAPSIHSHHRMGLVVVDGIAHISRRYAIDWRQSKQGRAFAGDAYDVRSYYSYDEKVIAVADGTVIAAIDGFPDNIPRTATGFNTAVPITRQTIAGNAIVIDLGDGQFASYSHLQPGSVRVKPGEHVQRGQELGRVGNSGDSRLPHLHFQVSTTPDILASEGAPFVIDQYRLKVKDKDWQTRTREFPLAEGVIDFGTGTAEARESGATSH